MQLGQGGLKTLFDLGSAQQKQGQAILDNPMAQTQQFANLLRGANIPMGSTMQSTGSEGYSPSPLSQIAGLGTLFGALFNNPAPKTPVKARGGVMHKPKSGGVRLADGGMAPAGSEYHDGKGNFYDANGYLVE
jgi:hypothetical protein